MADAFDTIVIGVGAMGSAACLHLAQRGRSVLGLEQFDLVHDRGSSHGETRIIRQAYFEHPDYVPLLFRAYDRWRDLERSVGQTLLEPTGLLLSGLPESETIRGARLSASLHGLTIENLTPAAAASRWPSFYFPADHDVVFEPAAGTLKVEACVRAHIDEARRFGADIRSQVEVLDWSTNGDDVVVQTTTGEFRSKSLIITAGAWAGHCLRDLGTKLNVVRKFVGWFPLQTGEYRASEGVPTFYFDMGVPRSASRAFYGFPSFDGKTVKVAEHTNGEPVPDPQRVDRGCHSYDVEPLFGFLKNHLPGVRTELARHSVCLYTMTPDHHFIVDVHPRWKNVAIACGFSGHGYKFAPVIGEVLADLALTRMTSLPVAFLGLSRFNSESV